MERGPGNWPVDPQAAFTECREKLDKARKEADHWRDNHKVLKAAIEKLRLDDASGHANTFDDLLTFLVQLSERKIHFDLGYIRPESIMVSVDVPGERWEVEFMQDGSVEVERFISGGDIEGRERLDDLFARFSD